MAHSPASTLMIGIIGGGVAGMSCALWLKHLGYAPVIIEQNAKLGGQLLKLDRINRWVLGSYQQTSVGLAETYANHITQEAVDILYEARLLAVTASPTGFDAVIGQAGDTRPLQLRAIVIATGVRWVGLEVFGHIPGFQALSDAGLISFPPLSHLDKLPELKGKAVAVIGGGDNAHFTAKDAALAGAQVHLLVRTRPKARPAIRREIEGLIAQGRVIEHTGTQVAAVRQTPEGVEVTLHDGGTLQVGRVFVRAGFTANCGFLDTFAALSGIAKEAGYIKTDAAKRTSIPWVYAIGDVANAKYQSVVNAIAEGALAAQDLSERV